MLPSFLSIINILLNVAYIFSEIRKKHSLENVTCMFRFSKEPITDCSRSFNKENIVQTKKVKFFNFRKTTQRQTWNIVICANESTNLWTQFCIILTYIFIYIYKVKVTLKGYILTEYLLVCRKLGRKVVKQYGGQSIKDS